MKTTDYSEKVLEMLGVKPNEVFELTDHSGTYFVDRYLVLHKLPCHKGDFDKPDSDKIAYILRGNFSIIKKGEKQNEVAV